ncbi:hypothetical protein ACQB6R_06030 [Propionibacteriaceae bacterium G1746]|uniref:hypothetical protein n=1 Tax=Aestuariimicrobium sp. G57 TaxID=3418485 RepID=UPI003C2338B9
MKVELQAHHLPKGASMRLECEFELLLGLVVAQHGDETVRFALNVGPNESWNSVVWGKARVEVLQVLAAGLEVADLEYPGQSRQFQCGIFGYLPAARDSVLRHLRRAAGGKLSDVEEGIEELASGGAKLLGRILNRYAFEIRVQFDQGASPSSCPYSIPINDPDVHLLGKQMMAEAPMAELCRAVSCEPFPPYTSCMVVTPTGAANFHPDLLVASLVRSCVVRTLIYGQPLTAAHLRSHASDSIETFLGVARGSVVEVPVAVGLIGARLEAVQPDTEPAGSSGIQVGDGYLRDVVATDSRTFGPTMHPLGAVWVTRERTLAHFQKAEGWQVDVLAADGRPIFGRVESPSLEDRWESVAMAAILAAEEVATTELDGLWNPEGRTHPSLRKISYRQADRVGIHR